MDLDVGRFHFNINGLSKLVDVFVSRSSGLPGNTHVLLAKRYETFIRRRFRSYARGGGDWPKHAPSTLRSRLRKGRGVKRVQKMKSGRIMARNRKGRFVKSSTELLRDTGTLFKTLTIGAPGNLMRPIRGGVRFGIVGSGTHPCGMPIKKLALIHNQGKGHIPQRQIIVEPNKATYRLMENDVTRMVKQAMKDAGHGRRA